MSIKLSKASKMPCPSWSLQAIDTCPGSKGLDGNLVPVCAGCYATRGNYVFSSVKASREHNKNDWQRDDWEADMIDAINRQRSGYFRWFDSGDMYSLPLAEKIYSVMKATPSVKHWLPTRMHKFRKFMPVIRRMNALPNVVVRFSADYLDDVIKGDYTSTVTTDAASVPSGAVFCEAYTRQGKCGDCRACWDKSSAIIAYPAHGQGKKNIIARG
jgi:hypothetical protein